MNKRKNKLMSMTSKIFEPPKNRNAYIPYTDSEGNILKEEDIQFTDTTGFRGRRSMIWDEDDDETYTVLSDNVEAVYDDAGNFPISLKTTDKNSRNLPIKISTYTGETLAIHSGSCPVIDLIFTGPPGAGKTVAALMVNSSLFKDCIASNAMCSFSDDLPVVSPASKRYKRMESELFAEGQLPPPTGKGELLVPYQYYVTAKINGKKRHRIFRVHDVDGESCLAVDWKNKMLACTHFVLLLPADELLSKTAGRTAYYEQCLNELLPKLRALKSDDYKLKIVISKADLLDPKDFYLAEALEENSVRMSNGKLHKITHKKGFDEEAYNDRSQSVQAFLQAEAPNFYWSLVNQVDKSKLSFGLLSTLGCSPDEENNTYGELDPMFVDELIIPYLAEEGVYPYKVSENEDEEYEEDEEKEETEKKGFWERFQESDKAKKFLKSMGLDLEDIDDEEEEEDGKTNKKEKYKWEEVS